MLLGRWHPCARLTPRDRHPMVANGWPRRWPVEAGRMAVVLNAATLLCPVPSLYSIWQFAGARKPVMPY